MTADYHKIPQHVLMQETTEPPKPLNDSWNIPWVIGRDTPPAYPNFKDNPTYRRYFEEGSTSENPDDYVVSDTPLDEILELETLTIKLPKDIAEKLDKLSKMLGMNKASLVRQIIVTNIEGLVDEK